MSCQKCEDEPIRGAFYRWKTANIEIVACREHWLEIVKALNKAQEVARKKEIPMVIDDDFPKRKPGKILALAFCPFCEKKAGITYKTWRLAKILGGL